MKRKFNRQLAINNWQIAYCLLPVVYCLLLIESCNLINPASPVPSYIRIENITLTTDKGTQGSSNNAITDAWVYVDGQIIGVFEMPVNVPLLYSGMHTVTILPGVIVNGIAASRIDYPFYTSYVINVNLLPRQIDTIKPKVTYTTATFSQLEDFDQAGTTFKQSFQSADTLHIISDTAICLKDNGKCGAALLNASRLSFEFISIDSFYMPQGSLKYMELSYRGNYEFAVGLQSFTNLSAYKDDIIMLKPTNTWQKIYVNLNAASDLEPTATYFKVYFRALLSTDQQSSAAIYFDNIKVIHNG